MLYLYSIHNYMGHSTKGFHPCMCLHSTLTYDVLTYPCNIDVTDYAEIPYLLTATRYEVYLFFFCDNLAYYTVARRDGGSEW